MWSIADWVNPADCSTPCWRPEIWPGPSCPLHYPACLAADLGCWILSIWIICENKHNKIIKAYILKKKSFSPLHSHYHNKQVLKRMNKIKTYLSFSLFLLKCTPSMLVPGRSLTSRRSSTIFIFSSSVRHPPNMACSIWRAACSTFTPVAFATDCDSPVVRLYRAKKRSSQTTAKARLYSLVKSGLLSSLKSPTKNRAAKHAEECYQYFFNFNFTNSFFETSLLLYCQDRFFEKYLVCYNFCNLQLLLHIDQILKFKEQWMIGKIKRTRFSVK